MPVVDEVVGQDQIGLDRLDISRPHSIQCLVSETTGSLNCKASSHEEWVARTGIPLDKMAQKEFGWVSCIFEVNLGHISLGPGF
jgi:hypothetical protein